MSLQDILIITSSQNEKIKQLLKLKKSRERKKTKTFLIEGYREILRALEGKIEIDSLYFSKELFLKNVNEKSLIFAAKKTGAKLFQIPAHLFTKMSYRDRPDGLLALGKEPHLGLDNLPKKKAPFLLVAESIEKPGNLGTILRTADAVGVDGVIVSDPCTDLYNPNTIRSSVGSLFTQMVIEGTKEEVNSYLEKHQIRKIAASPDAKTLFTEMDFQKPTAIFVGSEQYGLTEKTLDLADEKVRIPMYGKADSLNVAQATTLLLYEVVRQRHSLS